MVPRVTYRLQFHEGFRFADAARLAPYLARLGISHVYASPYMKSRPGSTHGYDIVDHRSLNPELGDQTDFDRMVAAFAENGLGGVCVEGAAAAALDRLAESGEARVLGDVLGRRHRPGWFPGRRIPCAGRAPWPSG